MFVCLYLILGELKEKNKNNNIVWKGSRGSMQPSHSLYFKSSSSKREYGWYWLQFKELLSFWMTSRSFSWISKDGHFSITQVSNNRWFITCCLMAAIAVSLGGSSFLYLYYLWMSMSQEYFPFLQFIKRKPRRASVLMTHFFTRKREGILSLRSSNPRICKHYNSFSHLFVCWKRKDCILKCSFRINVYIK